MNAMNMNALEDAQILYEMLYEPEIEWAAINAASWQLVDQMDGVCFYESLGFNGQLALIFADQQASDAQDWNRIYSAMYTECDRYWEWERPNETSQERELRRQRAATRARQLNRRELRQATGPML